MWVPSPNYFAWGLNPRAIVIHTMAGTLEATDVYFKQPSSQVSAHYGVAQDGRIHQYVATTDKAWAQGVLKLGHLWLWGFNPNDRAISIETEGQPNDPISSTMYDTVRYLCRLSIEKYDTITHLYAHNAIANTQCPGSRWLSGPLSKLATELNLVLVQ